MKKEPKPDDPEMNTVRLGCAILVTIVVLFFVLSVGTFESRIVSSARTVRAIEAAHENPTPENEAIVEKLRKADDEDYQRRQQHEATVSFLIVFSFVASFWLIWWFHRRPFSRNPVPN